MLWESQVIRRDHVWVLCKVILAQPSLQGTPAYLPDIEVASKWFLFPVIWITPRYLNILSCSPESIQYSHCEKWGAHSCCVFPKLMTQRQENKWEIYFLQIQAVFQGKGRMTQSMQSRSPGTKPRDTGIDTETCVFLLGQFPPDKRNRFPGKWFWGARERESKMFAGFMYSPCYTVWILVFRDSHTWFYGLTENNFTSQMQTHVGPSYLIDT